MRKEMLEPLNCREANCVAGDSTHSDAYVEDRQVLRIARAEGDPLDDQVGGHDIGK